MSDAAVATQGGTGSRHVVLGVVIAAAGATFCSASFNYVIRPMLTSLDASETQRDLLRQLPGIGGLLAIFVAGILVMRLGPRRCLTGAGVLMIIGFLLTCVATSMWMVTLGLLTAYIGKAAVVVIVVSLLATSITGKDARASAFASLAMVSPAVSVVIPPLAGYLVDTVGWRSVAAIWLLGGVLVILSSLFLVPRTHEDPGADRGELWTPVLAGVVLVGLTQVVRLIPADGLSSTAVLVAAGITVAALVTLLVLMRRMQHPAMSFAVLRHGGLFLYFAVVLFMPFSNMWFYGTVGAQLIYGLSAFAVALVFIPVQLAGVVGARLSGLVVKAKGLTFAGTAGMLIAAAMLFLCTVQSSTLTILVPLVILMIYGACVSGAVGTVTNAIMTMAPPGQESQASAFRSAASSLGSSLGAVFLSVVVFTTMSTSLADQSSAAGISPQQADAIVTSMRDGATSEDVSSQYSMPVQTVDEIAGFQRQAAVEGYWAQGIAGGSVMLLAAALYFFACRRVRRRDPDWDRG